MKLSWKTEDLEILNRLEGPEKEGVLKEFHTGRHFLSVYFSSLILPLFSFGISAYLIYKYYPSEQFNFLFVFLLSLVFGGFFRIIEVTLLHSKAIKDIVSARSNKAETENSKPVPPG